MNKLFSKVATLSVGLAMAIGVGVAVGSRSAKVVRAAEDDTHEISDFTGKGVGVVINNGTTPDAISITDPGYSVKQVIIGWSHNKSNDGVTASVSVGGDSLGSGTVGGQKTAATTTIGSGSTSLSGVIKISWTNGMTGTGKGTLYINSLTLVEGASGPADVLESITVTGSMSKTAYYDGESWSPDGLVATGHYQTAGNKDISDKVTWTYSPASPALNVTSVVATATLGTVSGNSSAQSVTVSRTNPIQALYTKSKGDSTGEFYGYYAGFATGSGPIIMDGEYGIMLYNSSQNVSEWEVGKTIIHVTAGTIDVYNGLYEVKSYTFETVESADISPMITHVTTGSETASEANRSTNASGAVAAVPTKGSFDQDPAASDVQFTFTVGSNTFTVFYKKASQTSEGLATLKDSLDNGTQITLDGFTSWYNGFQLTMTGLVKAVESYTAEDFAQDLLDQTNAEGVCKDYPGGKNDNFDEIKAQLVLIWSDLASKDKYGSLPADQKLILAEADRDESGTVVEQAMARYDFLTGKYGLSNFINGRTPFVPAGSVYGNLALESNATILIVITIAAVSTLAFTMLLVFKKKKQK